MDESTHTDGFGNRKKVTVRLSKPVRYSFEGEEKRLLPLSDASVQYSITVEMILPSVDLEPGPFVRNLIGNFRPEHIADRMQILLEKSDDKDFTKALDQAEYDVVRLSAARVLGSDDDPTRVYRFLGDILKEASKRMERENGGFVQKLTAALHDRGLLN